ncbi:MAG: hypothetical protein KA243_00510 [Candidatus Aminicenantes bacterium]|nr:hypothetical protein [Candidatus Aminicenantes bacterium]
MKIETSRSTEFDGYRIEDVVFRGACPPDDRGAFASVRSDLEALMRARDPAGVMLDLLDVDDILDEDLRELVDVAVCTDRPLDPRLCVLAIRMVPTVIRRDGTLAHGLFSPHVLSLSSFKPAEMDELKARLDARKGKPHGRRPVYFPATKLWFLPPKMRASLDESSGDENLWRMGEPSFLGLSLDPAYHGYRFLWLRSFHPSIAVRIDVEPSGRGVLTAKRLSGKGGYHPGRLVEARSKDLSARTARAFLDRLARADFWHSLPLDRSGLDGAYWILEGVKDGSYHIEERWSPARGAFRNACLFLLERSGLDIDPVY